MPAKPLPIIGRERALVNAYARKLNMAILSQKGTRGRTSDVGRWDTRRGAAWEVLLEVDGKATGHICRVEITLDRFDPDLVED